MNKIPCSSCLYLNLLGLRAGNLEAIKSCCLELWSFLILRGALCAYERERKKETERVKLGVCPTKQLQIEQPLLCVDFIHLLHRISSEGNISWLKKRI